MGLHAGPRTAPRAPIGTAVSNQVQWLGSFLLFCVRTVAAVPLVMRRYRSEVWRLLAEIAFGKGLLTVAASTIAVAALLSAVIGVQLGLEGLNGLKIVGLSPLSGLIAAVGNTRELAPLITAFGLAAQMGCRFTAQLGAMRISGEVTALDTMAVPSLEYLVTTRLIAVSIFVVPLYLVSLSGAYLASRLTVLLLAGQGAGTYDHYFYLFLDPIDVVYSILKVVVMALIITFVHCYYGYTADGGPEGVGVAAGRAIRMSIVLIAVSDMLMTLLFWGATSGIRISG